MQAYTLAATGVFKKLSLVVLTILPRRKLKPDTKGVFGKTADYLGYWKPRLVWAGHVHVW